MSAARELPIPAIATQSSQATELLRVWIVDGKQIVTLSEQTWSDPAAWGLMLADLARHVVKAYAFEGLDAAAALARMRQGLDAEWQHPTDPIR